MQAEVQKRYDCAKPMQSPGSLGSSNYAEKSLGPTGIVKLKRHPRNHQQQEARYDQEMQKALERFKPGEPLATVLGIDLGFPKVFESCKYRYPVRKSQAPV